MPWNIHISGVEAGYVWQIPVPIDVSITMLHAVASIMG